MRDLSLELLILEKQQPLVYGPNGKIKYILNFEDTKPKPIDYVEISSKSDNKPNNTQELRYSLKV